MPSRIWPSGDGVALAAFGNLLVSVLLDKPSIEGLDRIVCAADEVLGEYGPFVNLTVISRGQLMPDREYRDYSSKVAKERIDTTQINLLVLEGEGFWLATARMVLSALERRSSSPLEVERTLRAALTRVRDLVEGVDDVENLFSDVESWVNSVRS